MERTCYHRTKRMRRHKKSTVKAESQTGLSCRIPALYGAKAVTILRSAPHTRYKVVIYYSFFEVIIAVVFYLIPKPYVIDYVLSAHYAEYKNELKVQV